VAGPIVFYHDNSYIVFSGCLNMGIQVRERTIDEIKDKLKEMSTALNKISYLESALREVGSSFEIKRFLWGELSKFYGERKMFEKAAKAMVNCATGEPLIRERIENYLNAAEFYCEASKVGEADEMFIRASRDASSDQKARIRLARKNIYYKCAKSLESKGKRATAAKFYEKIIKMKLDDEEKQEIRERLLSTYKALGLFREARLIEGL